MPEITVERIRESKILWFCEYLIPLGLDWFENPDTGKAYLVIWHNNKLTVKTVRHSRKLLEYYSTVKGKICQRCGKPFFRAAFHCLYCKPCSRKVYIEIRSAWNKRAREKLKQKGKVK